MSQTPELNIRLHARQSDALQSSATEILYGGAAGGGKSHLMRMAAILWCMEISGLQVYLFRRVKPDLIKNHMEGPNGFRAFLAEMVNAGFVKIIEDEIRFWNGSKIYLCHCKDEKDRFKYQGAEIHVLLIDELTHFTDTIYRFLRNRVRMVGVPVPEKYDGVFPRIICGANPGNIGHLFVKSAFIDDVKPMEIRDMSDSEGGMLRQYIPAKLEDNPSMTRDDPSYERRLQGLGSEALVKAMRHGDWDVIEGAFFDNWNPGLVVRPFAIPEDWYKFLSFDWGSASPFSVGWWAVAGDDTFLDDGTRIPRGALVRYREWYGAKKDDDGKTMPNVGLKLNNDKITEGILERDPDITYGFADPAIFAEQGGPSISEQMLPITWTPADNKRVAIRGAIGGWSQMRSRIDDSMIFCFSTCTDSIRTIPALQHDEHRPEDLDTTAEDHAADEWRYACMSRPYVAEKEPEGRKISGYGHNEDTETEGSWKTA